MAKPKFERTKPHVNVGTIGHVGLKENVIIGKLIPAGTGMPRYRTIKLATEGLS